MSKAVHIVVFDGYADWEPALALAELRRSGKHTVVTVGFAAGPVTSMGGLEITPRIQLSKVEPAVVSLFILPGGVLWEQGTYPRQELESCLHALESASVPIAAICGATLALARSGLLNMRAHTSNELDFLIRHAPEYRGKEQYKKDLAVRDRGIITASGIGHTEFAREILAELRVFSDTDRDVWFELFKTGKWPPAVV